MSAPAVVLWHAWNQREEVALQHACDRFTAETGVPVDLVGLPFGGFAAKIETAIPNGNGPDLFVAGHDAIGKWASMGMMSPVDLSVDGQLPLAADLLVWKGTRYALPLDYKSAVLIYDPTQIDHAPKTTDELEKMALAHTGDGHYGLAWEDSAPYDHAAFLHGFGGAAYDPDGKVRLDGGAFERSLAFVHRLAVTDGLAPARPTADRIGQLYRDGKVAFVISGPWFAVDLDRAFKAAVLPIVSETGQPARPYLTVDGVFLAEHAAHPDDAKRLMAFLAGPEGAQIRQDEGGQAVSCAAVTSTDPLLQVLALQARVAVPMPSDPDVGNVFEAEARALRRTLRDAASPADAAKEAQAYYDVLSKPAPPAANPAPYIGVVGLAGLALLAWLGFQVADPLVRERLRLHWRDYLWVGPASVAVSVLVVVPFVVGAAVSLFAYNAGNWTFIGLDSFVAILTSRDWPLTSPMSFFYTLGVTVLWTASNLVLHVSIGVALALLLREPWIRLRAMWRALLILPWAVPNYITALIWRTMFDAQYGAVNALLALGTGHPMPVDWFGKFSLAFCANLATNTWLGFPFMMVITLGALQSIPRELEEAAEVDGAGYFTRFRHVVWPLLRPALLPAIVLGSVWTFNMFNVIYLVSGGEPDGATEILISQAYRWAFSRGNRYGIASAYAVIIFFVLLAYSRVTDRILKRST